MSKNPAKSPAKNPTKSQTTQKTEKPSFTARAVSDYHAARLELEAFQADPDNTEILVEYHRLVEVRNEKLAGAIQAVKSDLSRSSQDKLALQGIGATKRKNFSYDVELLRNTLPTDIVGLVIKKRIEYDLDVEELTRLVRQEEIDEKLVKAAYKEGAPTLAAMPGTPKAFSMPTFDAAAQLAQEDDNG